MSVNEKLWRREATHFVVEIKVGMTWVQHTNEKTLSAAESVAKKALEDRSVSAVRICEHEIVHTNTVIWTEESAIIFRPVDKMRDTGEKTICSGCGERATIAFDGSHHWTVCISCKRTNPCRM